MLPTEPGEAGPPDLNPALSPGRLFALCCDPPACCRAFPREALKAERDGAPACVTRGVVVLVPEQQERAFTLGLAGLLGEGVFNFGELVSGPGAQTRRRGQCALPANRLCPAAHAPVLESLRGTDRQWLIDTLYAFNSGNVEQFQTLKAAWGQQVSPGAPAAPASPAGAGETGRQAPRVAQV